MQIDHVVNHPAPGLARRPTVRDSLITVPVTYRGTGVGVVSLITVPATYRSQSDYSARNCQSDYNTCQLRLQYPQLTGISLITVFVTVSPITIPVRYGGLITVPVTYGGGEGWDGDG